MPICYIPANLPFRASANRAERRASHEAVAECETGFNRPPGQHAVTFMGKDQARVLRRLKRLMHHEAVPAREVGHWSVDQFAQIVHHQMRAMMPELVGISLACDADHKAKAPGRPGLHSREGILDDNRA
jgi:hypothetical protein